MQMAVDFLRTRDEKMKPFSMFYRAKPVDHPHHGFRAIMERDPKERKMIPYLKDRNGHKENPINETLRGESTLLWRMGLGFLLNQLFQGSSSA